jgi:outer membrane immunogenic protein
MSKSCRAAMLAIAFGSIVWGAGTGFAQQIEKLEVGSEYTYVRTNAPPGGCGCISLQGGGGWLGYNFVSNMALVAEAGNERAWNIESTAYAFHITSLLAGPRYSWRHSNHIEPFVQLLLGAAHGSGGLTPVASGLPGSANAFALAAGGGIDVELARHWALRTVQVDYYLTHFANGVNDRQNNSRINAGLMFRFGR